MGVVQLGMVRPKKGKVLPARLVCIIIYFVLNCINIVYNNLLTMRLLFIAFFLAPACTGFLARVRDHFEKKFKKPECHLEWEDVSTPHCQTTHEQVCP